jgi:hypothetical protein
MKFLRLWHDAWQTYHFNLLWVHKLVQWISAKRNWFHPGFSSTILSFIFVIESVSQNITSRLTNRHAIKRLPLLLSLNIFDRGFVIDCRKLCRFLSNVVLRIEFLFISEICSKWMTKAYEVEVWNEVDFEFLSDNHRFKWVITFIYCHWN